MPLTVLAAGGVDHSGEDGLDAMVLCWLVLVRGLELKIDSIRSD